MKVTSRRGHFHPRFFEVHAGPFLSRVVLRAVFLLQVFILSSMMTVPTLLYMYNKLVRLLAVFL